MSAEIVSQQPSNAEIEAVERELLKLEQREIPLTQLFAPGVYWREVCMPADTFVIGHEHKTEHFNVVLTGRAAVMMDGVMHEIVAPCVFVSKPGVRKCLRIFEDMRWATIHPTHETDPEALAELLIVKSSAYREHAELCKLQAALGELPLPQENNP
jgi:hypothetical protein